MGNHAWLGPALERLAGLLEMPAAHNSYACRKVDPSCAMGALEWLWAHMMPRTPGPRIMPTAEGGLFTEWPETGGGFRIIFLPGRAPELHLKEGEGPEALSGEALEEALLAEIRKLTPKDAA